MSRGSRAEHELPGRRNGWTWGTLMGLLVALSALGLSACDPPPPPTLPSYAFDRKWGGLGSGAGQFNYPTGVAIGSAGNVYVADSDNNRIQKFKPSGAFITQWGGSAGSWGSGDGQLAGPKGVGTDAAGNVYVVDTGNDRIQKFSSSGAFITKWGSYGSGDGQFRTPMDVAIDSAGNVYVADLSNKRIQKFSSSGTFITKWGSAGAGDGQFDWAHGVAVDPSGNVYVADYFNHYRIQKFSSSGTFITKWGTFGSGNGQFNGPIGVNTDSAGNVYVADENNHRIQKFSSSGTFITKWGSAGSGDYQFAPFDVAIDAGGNVYVADAHIGAGGNYRILKYRPSALPGDPGPTPARVIAYAPVVYLHPSEGYLPTDPSTFIEKSSLNWAHDGGCGDDQNVAAAGAVDAFALGHGGYSDTTNEPVGLTLDIPPVTICEDNNDPHASNDNTRPGSGTVGREGFFLNLPNGLQGTIGIGNVAPVYYEYKPQHFIAYWFFYAYNDAPGAGFGNHEGDWENITVRLDCSDQPIGVAYYAHGDPTVYDWPGREATPNDPVSGSPSPVPLGSGTHPLVYSAIGTHGSYAYSGTAPLPSPPGVSYEDQMGRGDEAHTWQTATRLADLTAQPWHGYGGAWGEVGDPPPPEWLQNGIPFNTDFDTTGPQGPHYPDKKSAPADANKPEGDWYGQCVGGT